MAAPRHVLIVDDDADVRDVLQAILENVGYRISVADGGRPMRDFLSAPDPVDLVVLDSAMPGERSASLALHLKGLRMPVVMISGSPDMMEFAQEHDLQLLWKPFGAKELTSAIDKAFASHLFGQRDDA
jgi:two-component system OmpR family response regulator